MNDSNGRPHTIAHANALDADLSFSSSARALGPTTSATAEMIIGWFQQAIAHDHDTVMSLTEALSCILTVDMQHDRLDEGKAQQLLGALALAHAAARRVLPPAYPRRQIALGLDAAAGMIIHWSENAEQRAARPWGYVGTLNAVVRMLRNDLHNVYLVIVDTPVGNWVSFGWANAVERAASDCRA